MQIKPQRTNRALCNWRQIHPLVASEDEVTRDGLGEGTEFGMARLSHRTLEPREERREQLVQIYTGQRTEIEITQLTRRTSHPSAVPGADNEPLRGSRAPHRLIVIARAFGV